MMAKNKLKKFLLVLAASATISLASCDDVEARMTAKQESDPILVDSNGANPSIYNNEMKEIYDALVTSGDTNSEKILNNILLKLAKSKFGAFYDTKETVNGQEETIEGLYSTAQKSDAEILSWVNDKDKGHPIFKKSTDALTVENVKDFEKTLEVTIKKSFWNTVKNTSYQERNFFIEYLFYKAERADLYELDKTKESSIKDKDPVLVYGHDTYKDIDKYFGNFDEWILTYQDYIERSILQNAYRKALVENYLISENYGVLGRSYARKVQYVAIKDESSGDSLGSVYRLFYAYAKNILEKTPEEIKAEVESANPGIDFGWDELSFNDVYDLSFLDTLYIGYFDDQSDENAAFAVARYIYDKAGFTFVDENEYIVESKTETETDENGNKVSRKLSKPFYKETKYGKLILDYQKDEKANNRWVSSESSTDFTNSNAYTKETGLKIETNSILTTNNVTEGWYTSSGLSDLASDFKTRLFKMNVANELDSQHDYSSETGRYDGKYTTRLASTGSYYLMPETYDDASKKAAPYILYDTSSTTWYIIRIDEAVKASKLNESGANYYGKISDDLRSGYKVRSEDDIESANKIVWEIAGLLGDSDTYKKAANQHYVEEAAISYHDQDVYDYFEKTFPDLFD